MKFAKQIPVILLAAVLAVSQTPVRAAAQEENQTQTAPEIESEVADHGDKPEDTEAENAEKTGKIDDAENKIQDETDGSEKENSDSEEPENAANSTEAVVLADPQTGICIRGDNGSLPVGGMLYVTKIEDGEAMKLLEQYFSLIAGQFSVYDIRIINLSDMSVTEPSSEVQISIPQPEGYDPVRTAVYYTSGTGMPEEVTVRAEDGNLIFESQHAGTFIIAEKKESSGVQTNLPSYMEPTQKVEKLELTKSEIPAKISMSQSRADFVNPQTGDDADFAVWIVILAAAAAAVIAVVVLKRKK